MYKLHHVFKNQEPKMVNKIDSSSFHSGCSDLGSMGTVQLMLKLGDKEVTQDFEVCRQLKHGRNFRSRFGKQNCAGVEWTLRELEY